MAKKECSQLSCREAGADCDFLIRAETKDEVLNLGGQHACQVHNLCEVTPEMKTKILERIRFVPCGGKSYSDPKIRWEMPTLA